MHHLCLVADLCELDTPLPTTGRHLMTQSSTRQHSPPPSIPTNLNSPHHVAPALGGAICRSGSAGPDLRPGPETTDEDQRGGRVVRGAGSRRAARARPAVPSPRPRPRPAIMLRVRSADADTADRYTSAPSHRRPKPCAGDLGHPLPRASRPNARRTAASARPRPDRAYHEALVEEAAALHELGFETFDAFAAVHGNDADAGDDRGHPTRNRRDRHDSRGITTVADRRRRTSVRARARRISARRHDRRTGDRGRDHRPHPHAARASSASNRASTRCRPQSSSSTSSKAGRARRSTTHLSPRRTNTHSRPMRSEPPSRRSRTKSPARERSPGPRPRRPARSRTADAEPPPASRESISRACRSTRRSPRQRHPDAVGHDDPELAPNAPAPPPIVPATPRRRRRARPTCSRVPEGRDAGRLAHGRKRRRPQPPSAEAVTPEPEAASVPEADAGVADVVLPARPTRRRRPAGNRRRGRTDVVADEDAIEMAHARAERWHAELERVRSELAAAIERPRSRRT